MYKVIGISTKATDYINKNSVFIKGKYIGCSRSDGIINTHKSSYKTDDIDDDTKIMLFMHTLKNNKKCFEEVQNVIDKYIFLKLKTDKGTYIKWSKKDQLLLIQKLLGGD